MALLLPIGDDQLAPTADTTKAGKRREPSTSSQIRDKTGKSPKILRARGARMTHCRQSDFPNPRATPGSVRGNGVLRPISSLKEHPMSLLNKRRAKTRRLTTRIHPRLETLEGRVVLSNFNVNTLADTVAVNLKTGQDSTGHISLRSAIVAADASHGTSTINVPAGTFTLTMTASGAANGTSGDLVISSSMTINGKGAGSTIINGNELNRVFDITSGKVTISGVTIENGLATDQDGGGGILNDGGSVTLSSVTLSHNEVKGDRHHHAQ
jgi:hypothetical protein